MKLEQESFPRWVRTFLSQITFGITFILPYPSAGTPTGGIRQLQKMLKPSCIPKL